MTALASPPATPWAAGRLHGGGSATLLFGRMFEDPVVELTAFRDRQRVLSIASAGDVAMALAAAGHDVSAIDVNPVQIAYVQQRLDGGPVRSGQADRLLAAGRGVLRAAGWSRRRLERLAAMSHPPAQVDEWRRLTSGLSGGALRALLAPSALRLGYRNDFARSIANLRHDLPRRIEHGMAVHGNAQNPWAQLLLTGRWPTPSGAAATPSGAAGSLRLEVADVATHLEGVPAGSYDGFALSNVLDGAPAGYRQRLMAAVDHAAAPGAAVVLRTLATGSVTEAAAAIRDRALLWGGLQISMVGGAR